MGQNKVPILLRPGSSNARACVVMIWGGHTQRERDVRSTKYLYWLVKNITWIKENMDTHLIITRFKNREHYYFFICFHLVFLLMGTKEKNIHVQKLLISYFITWGSFMNKNDNQKISLQWMRSLPSSTYISEQHRVQFCHAKRLQF